MNASASDYLSSGQSTPCNTPGAHPWVQRELQSLCRKQRTLQGASGEVPRNRHGYFASLPLDTVDSDSVHFAVRELRKIPARQQ
jgi:hypothetical protein